MEISKFFDTLNLHDSPVENIEYSPEEKLLKVEIELCNYDQRSFREGDPEMVSGSLIFSGVEEFQADPSLDGIKWGSDFGGEITGYGHVPERDKNGLQSAGLIIYCYTYNPHAQIVLIIDFLASEAEWRPLPSESSVNS